MCLKAPGFNPWSYEVISCVSSKPFIFSNFTLCRYATGRNARLRVGDVGAVVAPRRSHDGGVRWGSIN
jgi:hypothetical protein